MAFDPRIHNRQSIHLKCYDYSQAGAYYITHCVQGKEHLFGHVVNGEMQLNAGEKMVQRWWQQVPEKIPRHSFSCLHHHAQSFPRHCDKCGKCP